MDDLRLNPATKKLCEAYVSRPSHATMLSGTIGTGLGTLASAIAHRITSEKTQVFTITPEKGLIAIERIRQLYEQTKGIAKELRVIVIDDADAMSDDAQNALLKLLEEPVENVHFLLTTHKEQAIMPTIVSRVQHIEVLPLSEDQSAELLRPYELSVEKQNQLMFLATGRPAELCRLASDESYFENLVHVIHDAKAFLQASVYERLRIVMKHTDRDSALRFVSTTARLLSFSLLKQKNLAAADMMNLLDEVSDRIERNAHVKTQLMYLVTKLP